MKLILLFSTISLIHCRPQTTSKPETSGVEQSLKVTILPYYGGAKGQSLKITETPDGKVFTTIIKTPKENPKNETTDTSEYEFPPLPSKHESEYDNNIKRVHKSAVNIIKLQEIAKRNGKLNDGEQAAYNENMDAVNASAQNLAKIQDVDDEFALDESINLSSWFERKKGGSKKDSKKKEEDKKKKEEEEKRKKEEEKRKKEEEEKEKEEEQEKENETDEDTVAVNGPGDDASVAEAKPVGLAVAGVGGVAASKPIATAVVGPGGLAIARPVGTAIAGVAPDQALVPIYAEGYVAASKPSRGGSSVKKNETSTSEYLNRIINKYHHH